MANEGTRKNFKRIGLEEVDWLSESQISVCHVMAVVYIDQLYSHLRGYPDAMKADLSLDDNGYRDMIAKTEALLPEEYIKRHDSPKSRTRGLVVDMETGLIKSDPPIEKG